MSFEPTAALFVERLLAQQSDDELEKIQRYFKTGEGEYGEGDTFIGVKMGVVFALAKEFIEMPPDQIEALLENPIHEVRAGAVSIMAKQAERKSMPESRKKDLFDLYLRRTDRINNWDLVDLGAPKVIGGYLRDKPRDVLYELARSADVWERRTAILATLSFMRAGELDDAFAIAELLLLDEHDMVRKPVGGTLREAGKHDPERLLQFLDSHAAEMPRVALRYAIERLDPDQREHYLHLRAQGSRPTVGCACPSVVEKALASG